MMLIDAVLQQSRLDALAACDANVTSYDPSSFLVIFRCRGRQMPFIIKPLLCLMAWGVAWALIFARFEHVRLAMLPLNDLITPLLTPVSFLLVFRLGRAAVCYWDASLVRIRVTLAQPGASPSPSPITLRQVRYWDARAAVGKLVEVCSFVPFSSARALPTSTQP